MSKQTTDERKERERIAYLDMRYDTGIAVGGVPTGRPSGRYLLWILIDPAAEVLFPAQGDDSAVLADVLGLPIDDFADASLAALDAAPAGIDRLAVALITPEFMIA